MALRLSGLHYYISSRPDKTRSVASGTTSALPFEEPVPAADQRGKHGKERRIFQRILKVLQPSNTI